MSSISSSFSDLTDLENLANAVESAEVKALKKRIAELEAVNEQLDLEMKAKEARDAIEKQSILTSILGSWSIVASIGMEEYIEKWNPSSLESVRFQAAIHTFQKDNDILSMYSVVGITQFNERALTIGEKSNESLRFIENNALIELEFSENGKESGRLEMFVKYGQLHFVTKRFGMSCTRIYEKIGAEEKVVPGTVAELEIELEKMKFKATHTKKQLETDLEKKNRYIEELHAVIRDSNIRNHYVGNEFEKMKELSKKDKEELEKKREEVTTVRAMLKKKTEMGWDVLKSFSDCLNSRHKLKKELEAKTEEIRVLREALQEKVTDDADEIDETTPIETAILGEWKHGNKTFVFTMEDGHLVAKNVTYNTKSVWAMNDKNYVYGNNFAHTFIENNMLITNINEKETGVLKYAIERSIEGSVLTVVTNCGSKKISTVYERSV